MSSPMQETPDPLALLGHNLRKVIRALAGAKRISIAKVGIQSGIGDQKLRNRLDDDNGHVPTRLSVEETAAIALVLEVPVIDMIGWALDGGTIPLPPHEALLNLVPDLPDDERVSPSQQSLFRPHLRSVRNETERVDLASE